MMHRFRASWKQPSMVSRLAAPRMTEHYSLVIYVHGSPKDYSALYCVLASSRADKMLGICGWKGGPWR